MKRLLIFLLLLAGLSQCTKSDTASAPVSIFDNPIDPNMLLDTVIDTHETLGDGICFVFKYDNLNRVTIVDYYEYLSFQPINHDRISTFHYTGTNQLPTWVDVDWGSTSGSGFGHHQIYFFYNPDKSKNRDSIIDLLDNTQDAIRKYTYGPSLNYVNTSYYKKGKLLPSFRDSAAFDNNYNCTWYRSDRLGVISGQPYVTGSNTSEMSQFDNRINPLARLNIMPAMFMNNCIFYGDLSDGILASPDLVADFIYQNNGKRLNTTYADQGSGRISRTFHSTIYDAKDRIIQKRTVDSVFLGSTYLEFNKVIYKYHN